MFIAFTTIQLTFALVTMVFGKLDDTYYFTWSYGFGPQIMSLGTLYCFIFGPPFILNLAWWCIGLISYLVLSLNVVLKDQEFVKEGIPIPVATTSVYISTSVMLMWYAMIFIVGSYIYDQKSR